MLLDRPTGENTHFEDIGDFPVSSNPESAAPANENPRSAATDAGATFEARHFKTEEYRNRFEAARALIAAIRECHPEEAVPVMQAALDALCPVQPGAAFRSLMDEAWSWAALAGRNELKAYALQAFLAMRGADQRAFLAHLNRRAAA